MFESYYDLTADPFRLTPDPRFIYTHPGYLQTRESMRHSLATGEGIVVLTGRPGIGKSTLVQWFLGELEEEEVLCATLSSTSVEGEDLLRMVAYSFGLDARGRDKSTLLHELHVHLHGHKRALLVIDEAQNLSMSALEEVRMLTNMQAGSRALLQIFLVGQDRLHDQLHVPEMEQLHQRLMVSCTLEPLNLRETRDYIFHRLNCAGWLENPEIDPAVFVLVHRYAQGLPRHINQVCTQLFLHGAIEKRQRLDLDDVVSVVQSLQRENLTPLIPAGGMDSGAGFPPLDDLVRSVGKPVEQRLALSPEEQAFLEECPGLSRVRHEAFVRPFQPVDVAIELPRIVQESTRRYASGQHFLAYAAVLGVALLAAYRFGLRDGEHSEQGVFPVSPVLAVSEESVPGLKPVSPAVNSWIHRAPLKFESLAEFDYSQELDRILDSQTAVPLLIVDTSEHTEPQIVVDTPEHTELQIVVDTPEHTEPQIVVDPPEHTELQLVVDTPEHTELQIVVDPSEHAELQLVVDTSEHTEPQLVIDQSEHIEPLLIVEETLINEPQSDTPKPLANAPADIQEAAVLEDEIRQLLLLAQEAVASNRLKRPKDKNAWYYYSQVLKLEPGHLDAELGMRQIVTRYGNLIVNEINNQHYQLAQLYIIRAVSITPDDERILVLQTRLKADQQALLSRLENDQQLASSNSAVNTELVESEVKSGGLLGALKTLFTGKKDISSAP